MLGGRLEQLGPPAEVYERPATREVARFMGTTNFIEGTLSGDDGAAFRYDGGCLRLAAAPGRNRSGTATVTIRPERVGLEARGAPAGRPNRLGGVVTRATYQGSTVRYVVRAGSLTLTVHSPLEVAVGAAVDLTLPPEHLIAVADGPPEHLTTDQPAAPDPNNATTQEGNSNAA